MTQPSLLTSYPLAWIRAQYPALHAEAESDGIFLDNASGSQLPQAVIDAVVSTLSTMNVNKGGVYQRCRRWRWSRLEFARQARASWSTPSTTRRTRANARKEQ